MPKKSNRQETPPVALRWHYPNTDPAAEETPGDIVAGTPGPDEIRAHGLRAFFLCSVCVTYRPTPKGSGSGSYCGGTGYGLDNDTLAPVCYACCGKRDRAEMESSGRATFYLSRKSDAKPEPQVGSLNRPPFMRPENWSVGNWPGTLSFSVLSIQNSAHKWRNVQRRDVHFVCAGYVWHGINLGDSQILRCKRTRTQWIDKGNGRGFGLHTPRKPASYRFRYFRGVQYVAPRKPAPADFMRCGTCERAWNDRKSTTLTPAPAARCPFETFSGHN